MDARRPSARSLLLVPVGLAVALLALPLVGLLARAPWSRLADRLASGAVLDALRLSILSSTGAALASLVLGLPLALWLSQGRSPWRTTVRLLVVLPMVLPPVVGGVALLLAFGRAGVIGAPLERVFGLSLPFSGAGVVLAATWVSLPFFVLSAEAGLRAFDPRFAAAAASLGAGPWRTFRTVTLPMIAPSLRAGLLLAWARALGEFGATITFAGNLEGTTRTLPLAVYTALETAPEAAIALSLLLVAISALVLFLLRDRWFPVG
ncbi:ABC transporter permease [Engelhardtia mirabilis]|uniref:Molybdenum transport system permease n=1 Tax=Engelhardtia mirabilis TaxID=2528011 RepID=A0A518BMB4_9BACT|nr:Molybdenum transport system permease protein ModB [Planctomycetes bacterium Pla133]QDV02445.1 Molybdenum transport system permease protein ModB [Planctomycetes bacterium Pla86]